MVANKLPNRVRGIRQKLPANTFIGRPASGNTGPAIALPISTVAGSLAQTGAVPVPGGATPLAPIANDRILANISGSTASPSANTLQAILAAVLGNTDGSVLIVNGSGDFTLLNPGTSGQVLTINPSGGLPYWAAASGGLEITYEGAWNGLSAYTQGDVVTDGGSAYLCYENISAPSGGASIDGTPVSGGANSNTLALPGLTTSDTNDIIVVMISLVSYSATPVLSSISDGDSLTWNTYATNTYTPSFPSANGYQANYVLWAKAPSPLSSDIITIDTTASVYIAATAVAVNGVASLTSPFDTNASLPATADNSASSTPTVTPVSTSASADVMVFFVQQTAVSGAGLLSSSNPSGYTTAGLPHAGGGSSGVSAGMYYLHNNGNLSGATIAGGQPNIPYWFAIAVAIDGGATPNTAPGSDDLHWLSQGAASNYISSVDSNFAVTGGGELELAAITGWDVLGNASGSSAEPGPATLTALLDGAFGNTEGNILQRGSADWQVLAPGSTNQVLKSGGASAINSWAGLSSLLDAVFGSTEGNILQRGSSVWQVLAPGTAGQVLESGGSAALNAWATQFIASVDSNFTVTSNELTLASIADKSVVANISGSSGEPSGHTLTAVLDEAFGSTEGEILQRGSSAWQVLAAGTKGQLLQSGGASALNAWAAALSITQTTTTGKQVTTGSTPLMAGLGGAFAITPARTGNLILIFQFSLGGSVSGGSPAAQIAYGTSTAPSNGAAATGTTVGPIASDTMPNGSSAFQTTLIAVATGLTVGTAYWFDLQLQDAIGGSATVSAFNPGFIGIEY